MSGLNSRFISEKDAEARRENQDAEGTSGVPFDARSLYDRLEIEKQRKQDEFDNAFALKNRIHRLEKDDIEYLQTLESNVQKTKEQNEKELADLVKESQTSHHSPPRTTTLSSQQPKPVKSTGKSQRALLANVVKRPAAVVATRSGETVTPSKRPLTESDAHKQESSSTANDYDSRRLIGVLPDSGLTAYPLSDSDAGSDDSDSASDTTDVEDAASTLLDIIHVRAVSRKKRSGEEC